MDIFGVAVAEATTDEISEALEGLTNTEAAGVGAVVGVTIGLIVAFVIVWYILQAIADWKIFAKAGQAGWKSLIPIYHYFVEYEICWSGIYGLIFGVAICVNSMLNVTESSPTWESAVVMVLGIGAAVLHWIQSVKLAKSFGKGTGFGVLLFFFGPICRLILGFGKAEYIGKP